MSMQSAGSARGADGSRLWRDLERVQDLPSPPHVLQEIWRVLGEEGSSAKTLAEVLERDTALSAKLIRLASSAYFGLPHPAGDVRSACVVLGFDTVKALAIGVSALDALTRRVSGALDLTGFWRHSVSTGTAAQSVARRLELPDASTAFCAGILHDVGKLVLATIAPERYASLSADGAGSQRERETAEFGEDHTVVGAWIGKQWRFPPEIIEAIRWHHEPWAADPPGRWSALMHVADWAARRCGCVSVPDSAAPVPDSPDARAVEALGIIEPALLEECEALTAEMENVEAFVDLARS